MLTGDSLASLSAKLCTAYDDPAHPEVHQQEYQYYPLEWFSPYIDRRRKIGWDLYGLLRIGKGDKERMHAQHRENYRFFGAPVGLMFVIDRSLERGSWLDYGMFIQSVMVAARGRGLDTCPQAAFLPFHKMIAEHLSMPENEMLVCGMALGWADNDALVNELQTEREAVSNFVRFVE